MLFNSLAFGGFLPLVFLLYWFVFQKNLRLQNLFIVVASYVFYGWWDWRFLILIAFTSLCSWLSGILIKRGFEHPGKFPSAKFVLVSNIVLNMLILGIFKYYNFFVQNFVAAFHEVGIHLELSTLHIILPVGISFYTFQALSYSIDVYRKKLESTNDVICFFAYVSFFPQLVAGPIERATNLLPQFYVKRTFNYATAVDGLRQMLWGFFKKMVIADNCASVVNHVFEHYESLSGFALGVGAFCFAMQIYGDFSGYSDIAIGTARLFGFNLMRNFNYPYFSRDIAEFWRRWHISLMTWFRDYIYIPLGGSRVSKAKVIRNTFIIFLVSGLWHGANWTFVCWGAFHALLFLPLIWTGKNRKHLNDVAEQRFFPSIKETFQMLFTFILVMMGWIIFRSETITEAYEYILLLLTGSWKISFQNTGLRGLILILMFVCLLTEWIGRKYQYGIAWVTRLHKAYRWLIYVGIVLIIIIKTKSNQQFIYFQF